MSFFSGTSDNPITWLLARKFTWRRGSPYDHVCFPLRLLKTAENRRSDQPNPQDHSIIDHNSEKNAISRAVGVRRSLLFSPSPRRNVGDLPGHFRHVQVSMLLSLLCALLSVLFFFFTFLFHHLRKTWLGFIVQGRSLCCYVLVCFYEITSCYSWFATTWQGSHVAGQYNRILHENGV